MSRTPSPLVFAAVFAAASAFASPSEAAKLQVVTTLSPYASIAQSVGGDRVEVSSISRGDEDAHFVKPKPSFALMLRHADLFVTTGLDLELWAPVLIDKAGNGKIRQGEPGYVSVSPGIHLADIPTSADRSAGDVHLFGNPHIFASPLNAKVIAGNIAAGLERIDPSGAAAYRANLAAFNRKIDESLYGPKLLQVLGSDVLDPLAEQGKLFEFLGSKDYQGKKLIDLLGGWMRTARAFQGKKIVTYHKNWVYFTDLFGLTVVDYVEPKPGIPPSARHVKELIEEIQREGVKVILAANYFDGQQVETIAERTGCKAVIVPLGPGGQEASDYISLVDFWIRQLAAALEP
ncbi:MAG: zinc ABC transporter substrate-binding protein [Acidobacteria bacterium]|nr:zinc ABC transporter substrate-binding protein [Acidobacteriota bacterium]